MTKPKPCRECRARDIVAHERQVRANLQNLFLGEMHRRHLTPSAIHAAADSISRLLADSDDVTLDDLVRAGLLFGMRLNLKLQPEEPRP